jgi:8-oxo-dGTP diphosphatase
MNNIKWIFFDVGSTLVDESKAYEWRMRTVAEMANVETPKWQSKYETLYSDSAECLSNLHSKYKIGIIANQSLGTAKRLEKLGIIKYIDLVVASAEEGVAKPDRRIFEIALSKADFSVNTLSEIKGICDNMNK